MAKEAVVEEEVSDVSDDDDVRVNVQVLRKHVLSHCVGREQEAYDALRGLPLSGAVIHGKRCSHGDVQQAFGDSVQR